MKLIVAAALFATMLAGSGTASADPTPQNPGYQIQTPHGTVIGGLPNLPAICGTAPMACGLTWDPNSGALQRPGTESP
jgi:hypothetical protein